MSPAVGSNAAASLRDRDLGMDKEFLSSRLTVMSYELDAFGHVNNAVFLNYLEKARNDFMIAKGLGFSHFAQWGKFPVVIRALLEYKSPARGGERLLIRGWVAHHSASGFTLKYDISEEASGRLVLIAETAHVFVNGQNRPTRIPQEFAQAFFN